MHCPGVTAQAMSSVLSQQGAPGGSQHMRNPGSFCICSEAVLEWEGGNSPHLLMRLVENDCCLVWSLDHPWSSRPLRVELREVISHCAFSQTKGDKVTFVICQQI